MVNRRIFLSGCAASLALPSLIRAADVPAPVQSSSLYFEPAPHQKLMLDFMSQPHEPGEVRILNLPPRSGKTAMLGERFNRAALEQNTLYMTHWPRSVNSQLFKVAKDYRSFGAALTGNRYDVVAIEDPVGMSMHRSEKVRERRLEAVARYLPNVLNRLARDGLLILVESREDMDDATGWLLANKGDRPLSQLVIPAVVNGASFFPDWYSMKDLDFLRRGFPHRIWQTNYMQQV